MHYVSQIQSCKGSVMIATELMLTCTSPKISKKNKGSMPFTLFDCRIMSCASILDWEK